jgi:hypothetical protein
MSLLAQPGILRMIRSDAAQHFPITRATWGFSDRNEFSMPVLCLALETEKQRSIFPEEDGCLHGPTWQIDVWAKGFSPAIVQAGCVIRIPDPHDERTGVIYTGFYYDEHEGTTDNTVTVVERRDDALRLGIEGFIRQRTASMRPTRITVDATFEHLSTHEPIGVGYPRDLRSSDEPPNGATFTCRA